MHTSTHIYHHDQQTLHGFLAFDDTSEVKRPAVLVIHDWSGQNAFARDKALAFASMGYVGFAVDMYGEGKTGKTTEEKQALMKPLAEHRDVLQKRVLAAFEALIKLPMVDAQQVVVIGFCFGGLCALDLARSGARIKGAASFHGILNKPNVTLIQSIQANILVLHGYDDPMVTPQDVDAFCQEMTEAKANWQLHIYGQTQHAFMVPEAHDPLLGTIYQPQTASRAWQILLNFLTEQFQTS